MGHGVNLTNHRPNLAIPICLYIVYGCFHATIAKLSSCKNDHMAHRAEIIYHLVLVRENLPTPDLHLKNGINENKYKYL